MASLAIMTDLRGFPKATKFSFLVKETLEGRAGFFGGGCGSS
jgi:hypothetical protein